MFEPLGELFTPGPPPYPGLPDGPWPQDSPESQGMSSSLLASVNGIQHGVVIRHGVEVWSYGNASAVLDWASCNRTWVNLLWGGLIRTSGWPWLDKDASELPCDAADATPNVAPLKTVLSYTSLPPVGEVWRYSSGDWWPWQSQALAELHDCPDVGLAWALELEPWLGGATFQPGVAADGTLRVKGSCRDHARLAGLMLNGGVGTDGVRLVDAVYLARSLAGGPDGTGSPFAYEGYQTHLIRDQRCNAGSSQHSPQWVDLPGVPDGCLALDGGEDLDHGWGAIVIIPSLDLLVAARGSTPAWWLPTVVAACVS